MLEEFRGNISKTLIGVHVRRTDYKDLLGKKNYFYSEKMCYLTGAKAFRTVLDRGNIF